MLVLLGTLAVALAGGVPIVFAIGLASLVYLLTQTSVPLMVMAQRMVLGVDSFPLLALPLFLLAGLIMEKGGSAPRLMRLANALVGHITGGLAVVTVVASMFFAGVSGSGVADTAAVGSVVSGEMVRRGYGRGFTAALQGAAGVIGIIIPPSLPMVILGVSGNVSITALFLGGCVPGLVVGGLLIAYARIVARKRGYAGQGVRPSRRELWAAFKGAFLPLLTPLVILGGVMTGAFTPTESAVVAVVYALVLGLFVYRELRFQELPGILASAAVNSAVVLLIVATASAFGWVLASEGIPARIAEFFLSITTSPLGLLLLMNLCLLILGMFMETIAIILIVTPIFMPLAVHAGIDPVFFGILMIVNLAIGGITPPLGVNLITAARIVGIRLEETFEDLPYTVATMVLALVLLILFPPLVTFIPGLFAR